MVCYTYNHLSEMEGKMTHDPHRLDVNMSKTTRCMLVTGPVIVGAGPSGLAVAACLKEKGVPSLVIERSSCIASLWQLKTYDRLRLHLPKSFCQLPIIPFPPHYPTYPNKTQFVSYLEGYASHFDINPRFNESVDRAEFDQTLGFWRVKTTKKCSVKAEEPESGTEFDQTLGLRRVKTTKKGAVKAGEPETGTEFDQTLGFWRVKPTKKGAVKAEELGTETEYLCRWLIVATGENAEVVMPELDGLERFGGEVVHTSLYKSGEMFRGKKVLVVGSGNSGMEVCLDLCHHNAMPSIVVRDKVHVLPREMFGRSTFGLSMWLIKWLPMRMVDQLLLILAWFILGDTSKLGLTRPLMGPLQLKNLSGKTPVLDVGTLQKIKSGDIKVCPGIKRLSINNNVEFVDGSEENFDAIILATGYKSNVPYWLKEKEMFSHKDGLPRKPFPNGWKGDNGLYAVGFTKRGLLGASIDAKSIAEDIGQCWVAESKPSYYL